MLRGAPRKRIDFLFDLTPFRIVRRNILQGGLEMKEGTVRFSLFLEIACKLYNVKTIF